MANFEVNVVKIDDVIDHPDADRLTIVKIGGYNCIANKKEDGSWRYQKGDLVVYIPEQAVVPEWLLKDMGFWDDEKGKGMLAGSKGDRVKAIKLRGVFSQGILMPVHQTTEGQWGHYIRTPKLLIVHEGLDVAEFLGIEKFIPQIPASMSGEVWNASGMTLNYDIDNIQKYPDIFKEGEYVSVTEKLHGCLHGDSLVMLPNGEERKISEIVDSDISNVLSFDENAQEYITRKITGKMCRENTENKQWVKLYLEHGRILVLTSDHPVYSRDQKKWIDAKEVKENENIESPIT